LCLHSYASEHRGESWVTSTGRVSGQYSFLGASRGSRRADARPFVCCCAWVSRSAGGRAGEKSVVVPCACREFASRRGVRNDLLCTGGWLHGHVRQGIFPLAQGAKESAPPAAQACPPPFR